MAQAVPGGAVRSGYSDPAPYPEIRVTAPNRRYAAFLMDDYAGMVSEMTAVAQYLYHAAVLMEQAANVSQMLHRISLVEMKHLQILSELILLLGGNPVYRGNFSTNMSFWSGRFVHYGNTLCDRLRADLSSERQAIRNYNKRIAMIGDPLVQAILQRTILDETIHMELFEKAISENCG